MNIITSTCMKLFICHYFYTFDRNVSYECSRTNIDQWSNV